MSPVDHLDLNLLVALDVLLDEGSVSAAADRLHLSQPAMSRTLGRIRRATGDQILVRSGRVMLPTPYADSVRDQVRAVVEQARGLLGPARGIDPSTLTRAFTLRCNDALIDAAGPAIAAAVRAQAPGVQLCFLAEAATDTLDLRTGRVDLEIGAGPSGNSRSLPDVRSETVGYGGLIVAARPGHPALFGNPGPAEDFFLEAYAAAEHVVVSRRGRLRDRIDDLLAERGLSRRVVACVPTSDAAFRLVARADLLVAVPSVLAREAVPAAGLRALALPAPLAEEIEPVPVAMSWHLRYDGDGAHAWMRSLVRGVLAAAMDNALR